MPETQTIINQAEDALSAAVAALEQTKVLLDQAVVQSQQIVRPKSVEIDDSGFPVLRVTLHY